MHVSDGAAQERAKYAELWTEYPEYRVWSPGMDNVGRFVDVIEPKAYETLIDVGCGEGKAGLKFEEKWGLRCWWLDITDAGLAPEVQRERFIASPIWEDWHENNAGHIPRYRRWDYAYCVDVMEHLPPEYAMLAVDRVVSCCRNVAWIALSNSVDDFGKLIGQPLHLTVKPFAWWLLRIATLGDVIDARDLCGSSLFVVKGRAA